VRPCFELLWLADAQPDDTGLRALARAHPDASRAPYVSRSYRAPLALVAWHDQPLGVDIERVEPSDRAFAESICTPAELDLLRDRLDDDRFVTSLWSSKEALAKALGDPVAYDPRRLDSPLTWHDACAAPWNAHEFTPAPGHVAWLVWREPSQSSWPSLSQSSEARPSQNSAASPSSADSSRRRAGRR
jgi:hypothetical protein